MENHSLSCATLRTCCELGRSGNWKAASSGVQGLPAIGTIPLGPSDLGDLAALVSQAPAGFVDAAASFLRVREEPEALPWAVLDALFGHAVAGMEVALMERNWDLFLAYAGAALHLPCGTRLRQAVLEVTFRSVLAAASSEDSYEVAQLVADLRLEIELSAQYPELANSLEPEGETGPFDTNKLPHPAVRPTKATASKRESTFDQQFIAACDELAWQIAADVLAEARPSLDRLALNPDLSRAFQVFVTSAPHSAVAHAQRVIGQTGDVTHWRTAVLVELTTLHLRWAQRFLDWGDFGLAHAQTAAAILIRGRTQEHEAQLSGMVSPFIVALRNQPLPDLSPLAGS